LLAIDEFGDYDEKLFGLVNLIKAHDVAILAQLSEHLDFIVDPLKALLFTQE